jgi:DNA-binding phage protein
MIGTDHRIPAAKPIDHLPIAVRAYVPLANAERPRRSRPSPEPSEWVLVFDTETTTDPSQRLRFGSFQLRHAGKLVKHGLFYDATALTKRDQRVLVNFARANGLELLTVGGFVENVFFRFGYELRTTIVGFNLPFDISRLAVGHNSARRRPMRGGFSFQLSTNRWRPRVQVKHLSRRASIIRFTAPPKQRTPRGIRKHYQVPVRRGFFVDVKTIGAALTSRSDTLGSLAEFLNVPSRKMATEEHGGPLTPEYLAYAMQDVQVTWECFAELNERYAKHALTATPMHRIKSEAGIGKAYLKQMGIKPWRLVQPDFPPEIVNNIMQTYFGGRSEVHLRRVISQILYCDFLSMYPTVCTLMGLWRWVIAKGVSWRDTTDETRALLARVTKSGFQSRAMWPALTTLVQVMPDRDILPVRSQYGGEAQYTIGLNEIGSDEPLWYTLADCINSKFATKKPPSIVRALTFEPKGMQVGLRPVDVDGNPDFHIDPRSGDFYKAIIELRSSIKARLKTCPPSGREALDSQQQTLKTLANSTSYGIFVEINVEELAEPAPALRYSDDGAASKISVDKGELPGAYFHPLLATLITAAARLLLGIAEHLAADAGLDWAFCDTDSMAFAKPAGMAEAEFYRRVAAICAWFNVLNPYQGAGELLKREDANFELIDGRPTDTLAPLYIWAISAKRYALFNIDIAGKPVLRKASAHGLGHLMAPYSDADAPASIPAPMIPLKDIGVERWQHDVWHRIVEAALDGNPDRPNIADLPRFDQPAASRYAATTPSLLRWFDRFNEGRDYANQVRPFNFLTVFPARRSRASDLAEVVDDHRSDKRRHRDRGDLPRPAAPYNTDQRRAAANCFDRLTGDPIPPHWLKTYAEALADYHLHPEAKFLNGDYLDRGPTVRRHVHVAGVRYIGKEANRWEEQFYLGYDPETQIEYDMGEGGSEVLLARVCEAERTHGQRNLAKTAGVAREQLRAILKGEAQPRLSTVAKLLRAISLLEAQGTGKP